MNAKKPDTEITTLTTEPATTPTPADVHRIAEPAAPVETPVEEDAEVESDVLDAALEALLTEDDEAYVDTTPDGTGGDYWVRASELATEKYETNEEADSVTWLHIIDDVVKAAFAAEASTQELADAVDELAISVQAWRQSLESRGLISEEIEVE
jgi:hypothetical protein